MNVWVLDHETCPERHKNAQDLGMCASLLVGGEIKLATSSNLFLSSLSLFEFEKVVKN